MNMPGAGVCWKKLESRIGEGKLSANKGALWAKIFCGLRESGRLLERCPSEEHGTVMFIL